MSPLGSKNEIQHMLARKGWHRFFTDFLWNTLLVFLIFIIYHSNKFFNCKNDLQFYFCMDLFDVCQFFIFKKLVFIQLSQKMWTNHMLQACKFHMQQENTFKSGFLMRTLFFCSKTILKCGSIVLHKTSSTNWMRV